MVQQPCPSGDVSLGHLTISFLAGSGGVRCERTASLAYEPEF